MSLLIFILQSIHRFQRLAQKLSRDQASVVMNNCALISFAPKRIIFGIGEYGAKASYRMIAYSFASVKLPLRQSRDTAVRQRGEKVFMTTF